jgi:phospholipid/cholesterol/gamma-HCH transport system substrate-binding protein
VSVIRARKGYNIFAYFNSIAGLEKNSSVRLAGVKVGIVRRIKLKDGKAEVSMIIDPEIKIPKDSIACVSSLGLMGEKYIEIVPGKEQEYVQPNGIIKGFQPPSMDQLASMFMNIGKELESLSQQFQRLFGDEETSRKISNIIENLEEVSIEINKIELVKTFNDFEKTINNFNKNAKEISEKLSELTSIMKEIAEENKGKIRNNLERIENLIKEAEKTINLLNKNLEKIDKGQGTIGKLVNDPEFFKKIDETVTEAENQLANISKVKLDGSFWGYYLTSSNSFKNYIDFSLLYGDDLSLRSQIIKENSNGKFKFSIIGEKKISFFWVKGGIIESEFGMGIDFPMSEKMKISFDIFDLNREKSPHLRLLTKYSFYKKIYMVAGIEDFTLAEKRGFFFGLGIGIK